MKKNKGLYILGAGVTGITAGIHTGAQIFEAMSYPGGIASSYHMDRDGQVFHTCMSRSQETYRFEIGGGHWIFGMDHELSTFLNPFGLWDEYKRNAAVYFASTESYVPYPLQNNLRFFNDHIQKKVVQELAERGSCNVSTMEEWLFYNFGATLCEIFFSPFHELYTDGLYRYIAPQNPHKSPCNRSLILQGMQSYIPPTGYNTTFIYPQEGLRVFIERMAAQCSIQYEKQIEKIDLKNHELYFSDGTIQPYEKIISSIPLNCIMRFVDAEISAKTDPYTSVLVLNIGAVRGKRCPHEHWLYIPDSQSGFYRIGLYSNVNKSFLPYSGNQGNELVSLYVERAYQKGRKPLESDIADYIKSTIAELQAWSFIKSIEGLDHNWIEVAYTWSWPGSSWKNEALQFLSKNDICSIGRYGRWQFQGIADSMREGISVVL